MGEPQVEVRRSKRRRRTVSAYRDGGKVVVLLPARMSRAEEKQWVAEMLSRLQRSETRRRSPARESDDALLTRCRELLGKYLPEEVPEPTTIRWVRPMRTRWASCTPGERSIRVSQLLRDVPSWVLDYVLVHELAHLAVPGHGKDFWAMVRHYPRMERAIGYLEGLSAAGGLGLALDGDGADHTEDGDSSEHEVR